MAKVSITTPLGEMAVRLYDGAPLYMEIVYETCKGGLL